MKRLSIIIPVYNVEPYLERCLRSLEDQDLARSEYEIICINDGSPDNSKQLILQLQKEFDNIILIDQENQGVSRARNNGIDRACGDYILFIDPDDYVLPLTISGILSRAENNNAMVSFLGFTVLDEDGSTRQNIFNETYKSVYPGTEIYSLARGDGRTDPDRMWAVLFRKELLNQNGLRYLAGVPYLEDGELIARILCLAERCIFDGNPFYQRTTRPGSATNSRLFFSEKAKNGFLKAASNLKKFREEEKLSEKQKEFLNQPIVKFVLLAINSSLGGNKEFSLSSTVKELRNLGFYRLNLRGCNRRSYKINGISFNISPYLAAVTLRIYPKADLVLSKIFKR
jgi:glycosyltransferase involved in cell wall biosynthesis